MNEQEAKQFFFKMNSAFNEVGLRYFLFLGTLLGAIREKRFIPIDRDFDIGVFKEEFDVKKDKLKSLLIKKGFIIRWKFANAKDKKDNNPSGLFIHNPNIMKGFKTKKMHCDVCCFIKLKKWRYYPRAGRSQKMLVYLDEIIGNLKEIEFYGKKVKVPTHAEKFLELTYGKDWRIPHIKFRGESGIGSQLLPKKKDKFWWAKEEEEWQ